MKKTVMFLMVLFVMISMALMPAGARAEHSYFYKGTLPRSGKCSDVPFILGKSGNILTVQSSVADFIDLEHSPCRAQTIQFLGKDYSCISENIPVWITFFDTNTSLALSFLAVSNVKRVRTVGRAIRAYGGLATRYITAQLYSLTNRTPGHLLPGNNPNSPFICEDTALASENVNYDMQMWFPTKTSASRERNSYEYRYKNAASSSFLGNEYRRIGGEHLLNTDSCFNMFIGFVVDEKLKDALTRAHQRGIVSDDDKELVNHFVYLMQNHSESSHNISAVLPIQFSRKSSNVPGMARINTHGKSRTASWNLGRDIYNIMDIKPLANTMVTPNVGFCLTATRFSLNDLLVKFSKLHSIPDLDNKRNVLIAQAQEDVTEIEKLNVVAKANKDIELIKNIHPIPGYAETFLVFSDLVSNVGALFKQIYCEGPLDLAYHGKTSTRFSKEPGRQGLCIELARSLGVNVNCNDCSGKFFWGGANFLSGPDGKILSINGIVYGLNYSATDSNLSIASADGRYRISFAIRNYRLGHSNENTKLHIVDANLSDTVRTSYLAALKGRGISVSSNEVWKILDNIFQQFAKEGVGAFGFSYVLLTQPAEAQKLIAKSLMSDKEAMR